jgi:hypothetical protein
MLSLRTLHTSSGSYKNNYQVINKGYYFFKILSQDDLSLYFTEGIPRSETGGALSGNEGACWDRGSFKLSEPQFPQP